MTLQATTRPFYVDYKSGSGSPPSYPSQWSPLYDAAVERVELNAGANFSTATVWFPHKRFNESTGLSHGDRIRIRIADDRGSYVTIISGFLTSFLSEFNGGTERGGSFERNAFVVCDHRWLLGTTSIVYGQMIRGADDYNNYGTENQLPLDSSFIWASGRKAIFNEDSRPNRDPAALYYGSNQVPIAIFADRARASYFTARDMITYILCPFYNYAQQYIPIPNPASITGLDHADFNQVLHNVNVDGQPVPAAMAGICERLGWSFREDYSPDGEPTITLYKLTEADHYQRSASEPTILHHLCLPAAGADLSRYTTEKLLWAATFARDITPVVNTPISAGYPDRFEVTVPLVPCWVDDLLVVDIEKPYYTEAELLESGAPETYEYFRKYHSRGSTFLREVCRKWALNETGRYSAAPRWYAKYNYAMGNIVGYKSRTFVCIRDHFSTDRITPFSGKYWYEISGFNRGKPFDFSTVIPADRVFYNTGRRAWAPVARKLMSSLSIDPASRDSLGVKVEFSLDFGATWQTIPCSITGLSDEAGIYIEEANLAEMIDANAATIEEMNGVELNYFTSLADDKLNERSFKDGQWRTRVRVTCTIEMDQRLVGSAQPSSRSGSPFSHAKLYDFSDRYGIARRTDSSEYAKAGLTAEEADYSSFLDSYSAKMRDANEDMSVTGRFTTDRIWADTFRIGDQIENIDGRDVSLASDLGGYTVYPEIVRIVYMPDKQRMQLLTRDLRYAAARIV